MDDRFKTAFEYDVNTKQVKIVQMASARDINYMDIFSSGITPSKKFKGPYPDMVKILELQNKQKKKMIEKLKRLGNSTINNQEAVELYDRVKDSFRRSGKNVIDNLLEDEDNPEYSMEYDATENTGWSE